MIQGGQRGLASLANIHPRGNELTADRVGAMDPGDDCACAALRKASRAVTQLYDLVLAPTGLKATQFLMLKTIFEAGEIAQCDFAREHTVAIETLSRRFSSLRKKGLVELRIGTHHGERIYHLTPLGRKRFEDAVPYWLLAQRRLRKTLGESDWKVLQSIPNRVCTAALAAEHVRTSNYH
jgi:DNA-binding MarR family transcriptional regulator